MLRACIFVALLCLAAPPALATQLNYTLYVLGVPLADAAFSLNLTPAGYGIAMRFYTTGVADVVAGNHLDERSRGRIEKERPAPLEYGAISRLRGQDRIVNMIWRDSIPTPTEIVPPNAAERSRSASVCYRARS